MADHDSDLGRKIAYYRSRKGLSQREFAPLIKRSEAWLSQVERGVRPVKTIDVLERIAEVLEVPVAEFAPSAPAAQTDEVPAEAVPLRLLLTANLALSAVTAGARADIDLAELEQRTESAWTLAHQARYTELLALLEALLPQLEAAGTGTDSADAHALLARTYQACADALANLQQFDAAWVAADRAISSAGRADNPVLMAAGSYRLALVFQEAKQLEQARHTATTARAALEKLLDTDVPRALSVYGALTLQLAMIAARQEEAEETRRLLDRARAVATELGEDRNDYNTEFGPTNVDLHEVAAAVELGDAGTAIRLAAKIEAEHLSPERRGRLLIDTARAWAQRRSPERALLLLLEAENIVPDQVRTHKLVRTTTIDLLHMNQATAGLDEFAHRIGIDEALLQPRPARDTGPHAKLRRARGPHRI